MIGSAKKFAAARDCRGAKTLWDSRTHKVPETNNGDLNALLCSWVKVEKALRVVDEVCSLRSRPLLEQFQGGNAR